MNVEVEIRSFISKEKYEELIEFFKREGTFVNEDCQETYYFDCKEDLRIQQNNFFSKVWLKKGKMHDECREEIEVQFDKKYFTMLESLFVSLGFPVRIKWFRKRHTFTYQGLTVMLDDTKGYGYIIELEKMSSEQDKEKNLEVVKNTVSTLHIPLTPKEEFDKKFQHYEEHWKELIY